MKGIMKSYYVGRYLSSSIRHVSLSRSLSTSKQHKHKPPTEIEQVLSESDKDSLILEKFRLRKLQGSLKSNTHQPKPKNSSTPAPEIAKKHHGNEEMVVPCFEDLGLKEDMVLAAGDMNLWVPTEIQGLAIPAILEAKCVLLSSDFGSGRTLACFLPLLQNLLDLNNDNLPPKGFHGTFIGPPMRRVCVWISACASDAKLLRQDEALSKMKPKHPKAIVLCSTTESCDEGFRIATVISDFARLKSATESGSNHLSPEDILNSPIGMLIGTPHEVVQQMEEGSIVLDDVKYLVLDDADAMLENGSAHEINKITTPLKNVTSANNQTLQTIITTSAMTKMLEKTDTISRLERDNEGKVTAMVLEMEEAEAYESIRSSENLKKKLEEAIDSIIRDY